jgi:hypothetical protein
VKEIELSVREKELNFFQGKEESFEVRFFALWDEMHYTMYEKTEKN